MNKRFILCGMALFSIKLFSQVGINTDTPATTLDVVAKPNQVDVTDGIIAPRLTGEELKAKDNSYAQEQTGALVYVSSPLNEEDVTVKTKKVTSIGYYYFDGKIWQRVIGGDNYVDSWDNTGDSKPADNQAQNVYRYGDVTIGDNKHYGKLAVIDKSNENVNGNLLYLEDQSSTDPSTPQWMAFKSNLDNGSFSSLTKKNDLGFFFSTDNNGTEYSSSGFIIAPHTAGGGATPFGFRITEQGMIGLNQSVPTESVDIGNGTLRIRQLPMNGQENSINTKPNGSSSIKSSTDFKGLAKTQTFNALRTIVSDRHGVIGYVDGLPITKDNNGRVTIENLPIFDDNASADLPQGTIYRTSKGVLMVKY